MAGCTVGIAVTVAVGVTGRVTVGETVGVAAVVVAVAFSVPLAIMVGMAVGVEWTTPVVPGVGVIGECVTGDGVCETGVSDVFTGACCDATPVLVVALLLLTFTCASGVVQDDAPPAGVGVIWLGTMTVLVGVISGSCVICTIAVGVVTPAPMLPLSPALPVTLPFGCVCDHCGRLIATKSRDILMHIRKNVRRSCAALLRRFWFQNAISVSIIVSYPILPFPHNPNYSCSHPDTAYCR